MKEDVTLTDGEEMNRKHPDTFDAPSDERKRAVQQGDLVKVGLNCPRCPGERPFVRVTESRYPQFKGSVHNQLVFAHEYGLDEGDPLSFEARHILSIVTVEQQKFEEKVGGTLVRVDGETDFILKQHNDSISLLVLHRILTTKSPNTSDNAYQQAFIDTAEKMGLHPEMNDMDRDEFKETCFLLIHVKPDVDVYEARDVVRECVEGVEREAKRLLQEKSSPSKLTDECLQCQHLKRMGYPIPDGEITPEIARRLCPNCRRRLSFEKLECPISREQLEALCDHVDEVLENQPCDHTLRISAAFCGSEGLPEDSLIAWLREEGGACDCEVSLNIARRFIWDQMPEE